MREISSLLGNCTSDQTIHSHTLFSYQHFRSLFLAFFDRKLLLSFSYLQPHFQQQDLHLSKCITRHSFLPRWLPSLPLAMPRLPRSWTSAKPPGSLEVWAVPLTEGKLHTKPLKRHVHATTKGSLVTRQEKNEIEKSLM
jgi:hypothetical protein